MLFIVSEAASLEGSYGVSYLLLPEPSSSLKVCSFLFCGSAFKEEKTSSTATWGPELSVTSSCEEPHRLICKKDSKQKATENRSSSFPLSLSRSQCSQWRRLQQDVFSWLEDTHVVSKLCCGDGLPKHAPKVLDWDRGGTAGGRIVLIQQCLKSCSLVEVSRLLVVVSIVISCRAAAAS